MAEKCLTCLAIDVADITICLLWKKKNKQTYASTRWVDGTPTSEVIPGTFWMILTTWPWSQNGHDQGHEWPPIHFVQCQSGLPFWDTAISKFDHENPWSRTYVWSKVKVAFHLGNSKVKVKPDGHIWGLEFNRYVCFWFRGNRTIFGWYIAKVKPGSHIWGLGFNRYPFVAIRPFLGEIQQIPYLILKIQGQGHDQGQTRWSHLRPRVQWICLLFISWQSDHFWLRYSKFHIWPWKFKVKFTTKIDQNLIR